MFRNISVTYVAKPVFMDNYQHTGYSSDNDFLLNQGVLPRLNSDMRFVGLFYIIYGAFISLTIIGAIVGVPMLISGLRLREASKGFEAYQADNNQKALLYAFDKQRSFFMIQKIFIILGLVFFALYILFWIFFGAALLRNFQNNGESDFEALRQSLQYLV